jgi:alanine racemase
MPDKGMGLYNVINTYSKMSALVLNTTFKTQMEAIKQTEYEPFLIQTDQFGNLELVVNPVAIRLDQNLKKAMGMYRYGTAKKSGQVNIYDVVEQTPTELDPKKILSNYIGLLQGNNERIILDTVESMNVLARTSRKIPDSVKQGMDALTVIQQGLQ